MNLKLLVAVTIFAAAPVVGSAQTDGATNETPKPTVEDLQKLVQTISSDEAKLKVYCEIGKLQGEIDKALENNDEKAFDAVVAKLDDLVPQIGPNYKKAMDGLAEVDPNSDEGQKFTAALDPLHRQCR
jgi:IDEAL domain